MKNYKYYKVYASDDVGNIFFIGKTTKSLEHKRRCFVTDHQDYRSRQWIRAVRSRGAEILLKLLDEPSAAKEAIGFYSKTTTTTIKQPEETIPITPIAKPKSKLSIEEIKAITDDHSKSEYQKTPEMIKAYTDLGFDAADDFDVMRAILKSYNK